MRIVAEKVFDDVITGTTTTWYSPSSLNDRLGRADTVGMQACVTGLTGTNPSMTVQLQHSGDNQNWVSTPSAEISSTIANNTAYAGTRDSMAFMNFVRIAITLSGTNPQCRLKVFVTGHDFGHSGDSDVMSP